MSSSSSSATTAAAADSTTGSSLTSTNNPRLVNIDKRLCHQAQKEQPFQRWRRRRRRGQRRQRPRLQPGRDDRRAEGGHREGDRADDTARRRKVKFSALNQFMRSVGEMYKTTQELTFSFLESRCYPRLRTSSAPMRSTWTRSETFLPSLLTSGGRGPTETVSSGT